MSLINEALKKAQHLRNEGGTAGQVGPNGPVAKRAQPRSAQSMILLAAGAVVLVVVSMVITALLLTRSTPQQPVAAKPDAAQPAAPATTPSSPATQPPTIIVPISVPEPLAATSAKTPPSPAGTPTAPAAASTPSPAAAEPIGAASAAPAPASVTPAAPPAEPDERVQKLVDSLRVMGIRSSGTDSKVLMNDRVYRVNDYVDRVLGVKLMSVSRDTLTFTDANGVTYVKNF